MQMKPLPPSTLVKKDVWPLLGALLQLYQLKRLYRQGWLRRGVPPEACESVAEHSFMVAFLALALGQSRAEPGLDPLKLVSMALLHDVGEVLAGDITPHDGVSPAEKEALEREGAHKLLLAMPEGHRLMDLWEQYEAQSCPEARLVKALDKLELGLQARVYEDALGLDLGEFLASARAGAEDGLLQRLLLALEAGRTGAPTVYPSPPPRSETEGPSHLSHPRRPPPPDPALPAAPET
ncbi:MAG: HD domain-containing protein [Myxococcota bacterium]